MEQKSSVSYILNGQRIIELRGLPGWKVLYGYQTETSLRKPNPGEKEQYGEADWEEEKDKIALRYDEAHMEEVLAIYSPIKQKEVTDGDKDAMVIHLQAMGCDVLDQCEEDLSHHNISEGWVEELRSQFKATGLWEPE